MAATNIKEAGWFYHAPSKPVPREAVTGYPPPSQIPGLGDHEEAAREAPREMMFKDTDSKYIRLAKMGGRKDLLYARPDLEYRRSKEPVPYPRTSWYYLEDNAAEDAVTKKTNQKWEFLLPEYMVHQEFKPEEGRPPEEPRRPLMGYDTTTVFEREGAAVTDKTIKLPEVRPPGYGVRKGKSVRLICKQPCSLHGGQRGRSKSCPAVKSRTKALLPPPVLEERNPHIGRILAHDYQSEWYREAQKWHQQNKSAPHPTLSKEDVVKTEYKEAYCGQTSRSKKFSGINSADVGRHSCVNYNSSHTATHTKLHNNQNQGTGKERFILSRFKNVPTKLDTHRRIPKQVAVAN